jgi:hypothetical protein
MAEILRENPKDPLWAIVLKVAHSTDPSPIVGPDGRPARTVTSFHPECETTCHAPDEAAARAYVVQQNPGAQVVSATKLP